MLGKGKRYHKICPPDISPKILTNHPVPFSLPAGSAAFSGGGRRGDWEALSSHKPSALQWDSLNLCPPPWAILHAGTPFPCLFCPSRLPPPRKAHVLAKFSQCRGGLSFIYSGAAVPVKMPALVQRFLRWHIPALWHMRNSTWPTQVACVGWRMVGWIALPIFQPSNYAIAPLHSLLPVPPSPLPLVAYLFWQVVIDLAKCAGKLWPSCGHSSNVLLFMMPDSTTALHQSVLAECAFSQQSSTIGLGCK